MPNRINLGPDSRSHRTISNRVSFPLVGLTLYINGKYKVVTKKNNENLFNSYDLNGYKDIILPGIGFIYIKNNTKVMSNKELVIRKSIIGGKWVL